MKVNRSKFELALANSCIRIKALSEQTGLNYSTITRIKTGAETAPATVGKIAKALDVSVEELIEHDAATSDQSNKPGFRVEE